MPLLEKAKSKTLGLSPKVWVPFAILAVGQLVTFIATGEFDREQFAFALATVCYGAIGIAAGPGVVVPGTDHANDAGISASVREDNDIKGPVL